MIEQSPSFGPQDASAQRQGARERGAQQSAPRPDTSPGVSAEQIGSLIRTVADFPKPGIQFHDITTALRDPDAWRAIVELLCDCVDETSYDMVVGLESRGFILGAAMAYRLGHGFVPIRKPGKLPAAVHAIDYELEYGLDSLEIHQDALVPGSRVLVVDDLLATGGTAAAAVRLIHACGATVAGLVFLVELRELAGRALLQEVAPEATIVSLLSY